MSNENANVINFDASFKATSLRIANDLSSAEEMLHNGLASELISELRKDLVEIDEMKVEDRNLRIGIVGEVKAGKSSFLNALVFNGKDFLPKAPTPMTAALTKIGYSEKPHAKVYFYSQEDWSVVLNRNEEYEHSIDQKWKELKEEHKKKQEKRPAQMPPLPMPTREKAERLVKQTQSEANKACHELVNLVSENQVNTYEHLDTVTVLEGDNLIEELKEYVGSKGKATPLVKYTEIYLNEPALKDVEIVDTPGLNDPVVSRSSLTKDFLVKCDVVFLLSYVGQFFGAADINFLSKEIANANIRRAVLVGSKLDSGILDYNKARASFSEAYNNSIKNYNNQANSVIAAALNSGSNLPVLKRLQAEKKIYYTSSILYQAAEDVKNNRPFSKDVKYVIDNLKQRFSGFRESDVKFLHIIAGIEPLKSQVVMSVIRDKNAIIEERIQSFASTRINVYLDQLENINYTLKNNINLLKNSDVQQLEEKIDFITKVLDSSRIKVKGIFADIAVAAKKDINFLKSDIAKAYEGYDKLIISKDDPIYNYEYRGGIFGFFQDRIKHTTINKSADINEVHGNIFKFANEAESIVNEAFDSIFDIGKIKQDIKTSVLEIFKNSDADFDEDDVIVPLQTAINKLTVSHIKIDSQPYLDLLIKRFPDTNIKNEAIQRLKNCQTELLTKMVNDIKDKLDQQADSIETELNQYGVTFIDSIEQKCRGNLELVKGQLGNKNDAIAKNELMAEAIKQAKQDFIDLQKN